MSFQNKYLKYKQKYLNLKSQFGGAGGGGGGAGGGGAGGGGPVGTIMSKVINPINGKEYFYKTQDEFGDDVYTRGPLTITDQVDHDRYNSYNYYKIYKINGVNVKDNIWSQKSLEPKPVEWSLMSKVINPINGKEYFYKTQDEFGDDVYTRGPLTITDQVDHDRYNSYNYNTIYTINNVNVRDNIWLQKPLEPKPVEWSLMRKVINPINEKEYFYKTQDEFGDDLYTRGPLTITTEYVDNGPYAPGYHNTIHTINGVNVRDNIWLPKP